MIPSESLYLQSNSRPQQLQGNLDVQHTCPYLGDMCLERMGILRYNVHTSRNLLKTQKGGYCYELSCQQVH